MGTIAFSYTLMTERDGKQAYRMRNGISQKSWLLLAVIASALQLILGCVISPPINLKDVELKPRYSEVRPAETMSEGTLGIIQLTDRRPAEEKTTFNTMDLAQLADQIYLEPVSRAVTNYLVDDLAARVIFRNVTRVEGYSHLPDTFTLSGSLDRFVAKVHGEYSGTMEASVGMSLEMRTQDGELVFRRPFENKKSQPWESVGDFDQTCSKAAALLSSTLDEVSDKLAIVIAQNIETSRIPRQVTPSGASRTYSPSRDLDSPAKEKLAMMDLKAKHGVEKSLAEGLSVVIRDAIYSYGDYEVLSKDDVEVIAERTVITQSVGGDETEHLINIGRALGTKYMVAGALSKFGDTYTLSLRLIETTGDQTGVRNRVNRNCRCKEDELISVAIEVAGLLLGKRESSVRQPTEERTAVEWVQMALGLREDGKYSNPGQALDYLNKAIRLDPNSAVAYVYRSAAYIELEQYDQAISDCDKAIRLDPNFATAYNNRGVAYDSLGQYERAIEDYNEAIRLDPNSKITYMNREKTLQKQQPCFIATAAFGSPMHAGVQVLCDFRDRFLAGNSFGRTLIKTYYSYSPPIADFLADHHYLRAIVRWGLLPLVAVSWVALELGTTISFALMILILAMLGTILLKCIWRSLLQRL